MEPRLLDTRTVLAYYGIKPHRGADKEFTFYRCPIHSESNPSLLVYPDGHWFCFGKCAAGGTAVDFIMSYRQLTRQEALREVERISASLVQFSPVAAAFSRLEESVL
jgi:DNA primase